MRVSDNVGWVWIVTARSSAVSAVSTARAPSAISSPAPGPTIPTPSTRPVSGSTMSFVSPSLRPSVAARPEAAHGNFASRTGRPSRVAADSVSPHHATSGSVKTTAGTTTLSNAAGRPAIVSAATLPWRIARWASIGSPVTSPTAQMRGSAVRGVDLAELETDVAPADDEEALGHVGELERRRRVHHAVQRRVEAGQRARRRARRDDGVLEADLLGLVALHAEPAGVLEDPAA